MTWCWWCCHSCDGVPLQLPYKYDYRTDKFSTCGQFCSWSCMKTFTLDKYGVTRGGQMMCNIIIMRKKLYNTVERIHASPNRFSLKEFGGTLTIEEFRKGGTVDTGVATGSVEFSTSHDIEFIKRVPIANNTKLDDISYSRGVNEPLRLKRPKPLKRDENNLEKTLGITRKKTATTQ